VVSDPDEDDVEDLLAELVDLAAEVSFTASVTATILQWDTLAALDAAEPFAGVEGRAVIARIRARLELTGGGEGSTGPAS
jgi:hypothetical protein